MRSGAGCGRGVKKTGPLGERGPAALQKVSLVSSRAGAPCTHAPVRLSCKRGAHANATNRVRREVDHLGLSIRGGGRMCQAFACKRQSQSEQLRCCRLPAHRLPLFAKGTEQCYSCSEDGDCAFSSSNQLSTTISFAGPSGAHRIIRKRLSSGDTAYPLFSRAIWNPAVENSGAVRPSENVGLVLTSTATRLPAPSR